MLTEALAAVAASCSTAVVQAAGTDAWASLRHRLATLMGDGDAQRAAAELQRLERTAQLIADALPEQSARVRILQEGSWQARLEDLLESRAGAAREAVAEELRNIVASLNEDGASTHKTWSGDVRQVAKASGEARVYQLGQGEMHISGS
ncbi:MULTISPECIES: hypothetical protein [Streptomyces]|uniref:hypothetical protein n=1 Tax=Streptomyces TaxID=1883 RepID=UPI000F6F4BAE|nr:hypothetical protein [Streptomyces sp. W1SF4]AZM92470.1 hypothetical protein D1J60_31740 [Streptomyces sp. W1SF4]